MEKIRGLLLAEVEKRGKRPLCREMGISPSSLFNWLDNVGKPTMSSVERIATYFHKPISYFFDEPTPEPVDSPSMRIDTNLHRSWLSLPY